MTPVTFAVRLPDGSVHLDRLAADTDDMQLVVRSYRQSLADLTPGATALIGLPGGKAHDH